MYIFAFVLNRRENKYNFYKERRSGQVGPMSFTPLSIIVIYPPLESGPIGPDLVQSFFFFFSLFTFGKADISIPLLLRFQFGSGKSWTCQEQNSIKIRVTKDLDIVCFNDVFVGNLKCYYLCSVIVVAPRYL